MEYDPRPESSGPSPDLRDAPSSAPPAERTGGPVYRPRRRHDLAPRLARLVAVILDSLLLVPAFIAPTLSPLLIAGLVVVTGVQLFFLVRDGQTVGKKILGIAIVDVATGEVPHWTRLIFLRLALNWLLGLIPLYGPADALFIFRNDRRTIHDHIAGTVVVNRRR